MTIAEPYSLAERKADTLARPATDVDAWVATADGGHLMRDGKWLDR